MSRERKLKNYLVVLYYLTLSMPVMSFAFLGSRLTLGVYEHANLGGFFVISSIVLTVGLLYVYNYQRAFTKIASIVFISYISIELLVIVIVRFNNPYNITQTVYLQVIILALVALVQFAPERLFKVIDALKVVLKKGDDFFRKYEKSNGTQPVEQIKSSETKPLEVEESYEDFEDFEI